MKLFYFKYFYIIFPCIVCMYVMIFAYKVNTRLLNIAFALMEKDTIFYMTIYLIKQDWCCPNKSILMSPSFSNKISFLRKLFTDFNNYWATALWKWKIGYFINKKYLLIISKYNKAGHACQPGPSLAGRLYHLIKAMGNFYIVEAGGNGFAARKQKKIHPKGQKQINHFCPRALNGFSALDPWDEFFSA